MGGQGGCSLGREGTSEFHKLGRKGLGRVWEYLSIGSCSEDQLVGLEGARKQKLPIWELVWDKTLFSNPE